MSGLIFNAFVFHLLTSPGTGVAGERLPHEPEMVKIPGGSFQMGCVSGRDCVDWEHPVHEVRVEGFELYPGGPDCDWSRSTLVQLPKREVEGE